LLFKVLQSIIKINILMLDKKMCNIFVI
jgi:hypothetical protein